MFDRRENEHYDYPQLSIFRNKQTIPNREFFISSAIDNDDTMLYIHIPFCGNECIFCNYYKTTMFRSILEDYFNCMQKEISYYAKLLPISCKKLAGIHFGGGTPSIVPIRFYNKLLEHISSFFDISNCQISFEGNVLSLLQKQYIKDLRSQGINRVSFGVQTLNQELRSKYGLFDDTSKIRKVIYSLKENDILDVNADLMFNFPNQTTENVLDDVYTLFDMDVNCIDLYSLLVFSNTSMHKKLIEDGDWTQYLDNKHLSSFNRCFLELTQDDSVHFLMSNTITKNKHYQNVNLSIMLGNNQLNGGNVIGIGASSRGYINTYKYKNYVNINDYINAVTQSCTGIQLQTVVTNIELGNRLLSLFPNFTKVRKNSIESIQVPHQNLINFYIKNNVFFENESYYLLNPDYYFWAGNISSSFFSTHQKKEMVADVLHNRKEKLNMYNQDKMNIYG